MSDLERKMERFVVAAGILAEAYGEVSRLGRFTQPGLAAAAFSDMENLLGYMASAGVDRIPYNGADVNVLTALEQGFHQHECACPFCLGGTEVNPEGA